MSAAWNRDDWQRAMTNAALAEYDHDLRLACRWSDNTAEILRAARDAGTRLVAELERIGGAA